MDQITRKNLSIIPSSKFFLSPSNPYPYVVPRVVRTGDEFRSGVVVVVHDENFGNQRVNISVSLTCELLAIIDSPVITQDVGPGLTKFDFRFKALGTGNAKLIFRALVEGSQENSDSAQYFQDIKGRQEPVFIATSMAVSQDHPTTEGFRLPPAENYRFVVFVVGVVSCCHRSCVCFLWSATLSDSIAQRNS